jgi:hypothetical protein
MRNAVALDAGAIQEYRDAGVCVLNGVMETNLVAAIRAEILGVIEEVSGVTLDPGMDAKTFVLQTSETLWDTLSNHPDRRNLLYTHLQRVPTLGAIANSPALLNFGDAISMSKPSVREAKIQLFLPWERLFMQKCHQDINTLESDNSATFWIPLHALSEKTAVRYWVGSHREGPTRHEEVIDESIGMYLVQVPEGLQEKYPDVRSAVASEGDVIAINRLTFHQSPDFDDQLYARWSVVIRYDDISQSRLSSGGLSYAHLSPNTGERMTERIEKIRTYLSQKPSVDWREKIRQARVS